MMLGQGDDSAIPVCAVFMFVHGKPVVVNYNTHQGLKLVNGASYISVEIVLGKVHLEYWIHANTALYFSPPAGILMALEIAKDFDFINILASIILLISISIKIEC